MSAKVEVAKRNRKALAFYSTAYSFKEPYTVLLEGSFISRCITDRIQIFDHLIALLGPSTHICTSVPLSNHSTQTTLSHSSSAQIGGI